MPFDRKQHTRMQSSQALQATTFVGRTVMVVSDSVQLDRERPRAVFIDVPENVHEIMVSVYSQTGDLLKRLCLESVTAGLMPLYWDERLPNGLYRLLVNADAEGKSTLLPVMIIANVDSVNLGKQGEGLLLNVAGIGELAFEQVRCHPGVRDDD